MLCDYCNSQAKWVENKKVYGCNYGKSYMIWLCRQCDAYVGCHNNTEVALGRMANKELREIKKEAKMLFIEKKMQGSWKCTPSKKSEAYEWLQNALCLNKDKAHFGMFDIEQCKKVVSLLT